MDQAGGDFGVSTMPEFISEQITPQVGTFNASRMGRGEPGLPKGFVWREDSLDVVKELEAWKRSVRDGGRTDGELYLRRHYYKLRMSNESVWTVYFVRQTPRSGDPRVRWFLYTIEQA